MAGMTRRAGSLLLVFLLMPAAAAWPAEHPSLAKARSLYNAADYDGAISAASMARSDPASGDAASLVMGRSHLERHRLRADPADLAAARELLASVRARSLSPRDCVDLLVGLGQALYLGEMFGAAAEMFDTAVTRASMLGERDRLLLLDWWANAMDKEAHRRPADRRAPIYHRVMARMEEELRQSPGSAPANYWLAAAARGAGDVERAWHAAVAGWVRAGLRPDSTATLRADLDRLVTEALIPERARSRPAREQPDAIATLRTEWNLTKSQWTLKP
jgi:hypothetical protein